MKSAIDENPSRHIPALDGLRGCAILMVFYYHTCFLPTLPPTWRLLPGMGWSGVDLFFVLSGYLITNILINSRNSTNYYKSFYARRALRIAPVYYLALVVILLLHPFLGRHFPSLHAYGPYNWHQQIWYWLNLSNLRSAFYPVEIPLASVYWSLAIEEQFYSIWPAVIRKLSDRTVAMTSLAGIGLSFLLRLLPIVQSYNHTYYNFIYRLTPFRLDGLLLGALVAIYLKSRPSPLHLRNATIAAFFIGLGGILIATHGFTTPEGVAVSKYGYTALALIFGSAISVCVAPRNKLGRTFASFLSQPILRQFGKYSYFIYVFHQIILHSTGHLTEKITHGLNPIAATYVSALLALLMCYFAAAISWKFMEQPLLSFKRFFPYRFQPSQPAETPILSSCAP